MNTKAFTRKKTADILVARAPMSEAQIRAAQLAHAAKQKREAAAIYRAQESAIRMRANDYGIKSSAYWGD
jgi:hypothetical protein